MKPFIQVGRRIFNLNHIIDIYVSPAGGDEKTNKVHPLILKITTTELDWNYTNVGDNVYQSNQVIELQGDEAELFLKTLYLNNSVLYSQDEIV